MKKRKFTTRNVDAGGTSLVGEIKATYKQLKKLFGEPSGSDGYKSDAEWEIKFEDGTVATIYNWKDGKNYRGESGTPVEAITDWHVGGHDAKALTYVEELI